MKIGFIFECGPQGADKQICEYLAQQIRPDIKMNSRTLDNKANLLKDAGKVRQVLAQTTQPETGHVEVRCDGEAGADRLDHLVERFEVVSLAATGDQGHA